MSRVRSGCARWRYFWPLEKLLAASLVFSGLSAECIPPVLAAGEGQAPSCLLRGPLPWRGTSGNLKAHFVRGAVVLHAGSRFSVVLKHPLDSKSMRTGDKVEAVLLEPLAVGGITIADAGSRLSGWVGSVMTRRTSMGARLSSRNWLNSSAALSLHFSDMSAGERSYRINAEPAPGTSVRGTDPNVPLSVDDKGRVIVEFHGGKYMAVTAGVSAIAFAAGPAGLIAGPAISAALGASIPEYALDRPVDEDSSATRARGTLTGAVKGLPGGVLVTGLANRGLDVCIAAGEALTLELKDDFVIPAQISAR